MSQFVFLRREWPAVDELVRTLDAVRATAVAA
jgi:hypothetical protein